ncbi:MAG TPA: T9SS type A sorting domain-containing protein, partial [Saprospiraceae bacterium]|nr:T9SS type A sorting domain-containing protein [Saprospiraceae bacterium]
GTPLQSWDIDFFLTKDANDENLWTYNSIDLNGEVKFRADSNWTVNWGATDFPSGIGTQDGPNIPVAAGTYGINFNSGTGEYVFGDPLATKDLLNPADILVYPNPASEELYIDVSKTKITGRVNLNVYDIQGKLLRSEVKQADELMKLKVSDLQNGHYLLQITNDHYIIGKNFAVLK